MRMEIAAMFNRIVHITILAAALCTASFAASAQQSKDPIYNPRAVKHVIDRSAMQIPLQGWTRDLKYPVFAVEVIRGSKSVYYATKGEHVEYNTFDLDKLACEIGKAPEEVLSNAKYACGDGVCYSKDAGAIIGVDPRKTVKKVRC